MPGMILRFPWSYVRLRTQAGGPLLGGTADWHFRKNNLFILYDFFNVRFSVQ